MSIKLVNQHTKEDITIILPDELIYDNEFENLTYEQFTEFFNEFYTEKETNKIWNNFYNKYEPIIRGLIGKKQTINVHIDNTIETMHEWIFYQNILITLFNSVLQENDPLLMKNVFLNDPESDMSIYGRIILDSDLASINDKDSDESEEIDTDSNVDEELEIMDEEQDLNETDEEDEIEESIPITRRTFIIPKRPIEPTSSGQISKIGERKNTSAIRQVIYQDPLLQVPELKSITETDRRLSGNRVQLRYGNDVVDATYFD